MKAPADLAISNAEPEKALALLVIDNVSVPTVNVSAAKALAKPEICIVELEKALDWVDYVIVRLKKVGFWFVLRHGWGLYFHQPLIGANLEYKIGVL